VTESEPRIQLVAVIGAGTMGGGIAQAAAAAGCRARIVDADPSAADRAVAVIESRLLKGVELGKLPAGAVQEALARIEVVHGLDAAVADADLVIEAVTEDERVKRELFRRIAAAAPRTALLASNTSSIPIARIASEADPRRTLGLHFFNPVHKMPLVEIVAPDDLDPAALETARAFVAALGKEAIVVRDSPGFATSRLGVALGLEAIRMLESGVASAPDVDRAMELGYRHPMGPLRLTDLVGLDVRLRIAEILEHELGSPVFHAPDLLRRLVEEGALGQKAGRGFYLWREGKPVGPAPLPEPAAGAGRSP
jgi:3-hydroxybutyryl-CoA dehydrogenase